MKTASKRKDGPLGEKESFSRVKIPQGRDFRVEALGELRLSVEETILLVRVAQGIPLARAGEEVFLSEEEAGKMLNGAVEFLRRRFRVETNEELWQRIFL